MRQCKVRTSCLGDLLRPLMGSGFRDNGTLWDTKKDPTSVTDEEFWQLLRNFDESPSPLFPNMLSTNNPGGSESDCTNAS
jgi:hypothetical protein